MEKLHLAWRVESVVCYRMKTICGLLVLASLLLPAVVEAQSTLRGEVTSVATGAPVVGVEVYAPALGRRTTSDSAGTFLMADLPSGRFIVELRRIGFMSRADTIEFASGEVTTRRFQLTRATSLDTVATIAEGPRYTSPALRGFEERRLKKESGYFISEAELRKADDKSLGNLIASKTTGLRTLQTRGKAYLASSRRACSGPVFQGGAKECQPCFVTVYLDGVLLYRADVGRPDVDAVDFNRIGVNQLAGVEFYPASGPGPVGFNATGTGSCGLLLLWTRER